MRNDEIAGGSKPCVGRCGRQVSVKADLCKQCQDDAARSMEAKSAPAAEGSTHIIVHHKSQDQEDLYRANGMLVASRQKDIVRFGSDISTAQNRLFLNAELAAKWLRKLAEVDIDAILRCEPLHKVVDEYTAISHNVVFDERDLEKRIQVAGTIRMN